MISHFPFDKNQPFEELSIMANPWDIDPEILKNMECPKVLVTNGYSKKCKNISDLIIDRANLKSKGSHFIWISPFKIITIKDHLGNRPWVTKIIN